MIFIDDYEAERYLTVPKWLSSQSSDSLIIWLRLYAATK
jgi:hypothetical protein